MADKYVNKPEQTGSNSALAHDGAGKDKQRDRKQNGVRQLACSPHHVALHGNVAHVGHDHERTAKAEWQGDADSE